MRRAYGGLLLASPTPLFGFSAWTSWTRVSQARSHLNRHLCQHQRGPVLRHFCSMDQSATIHKGYVTVNQRDESYVTVEVIRSGAKPIALRRSSTEKLIVCLARLGLKLLGREAASNTTLALLAAASTEPTFKEGIEILGDTPNALAWASSQYLRAGSELIPVVVNRPEVLNLWCINAPMEGYPLKPTAELLHSSDEQDLSTVSWMWTRLPIASSERSTAASLGEVEVGTARSYTPRVDDVGSVLTVRATPPAKPGSPLCSGAPPALYTFTAPVAARVDPSSGLCPTATPAMQARHRALGPNPFTRGSSNESGGNLGKEDDSNSSNSAGEYNDDAQTTSVGPNGLRVLSLNLLADAYRRTWDDSVHMYRSAELTSMDRRAPVLLSDVLGFGPDVACLQEVDASWYEKWWVPQMRGAGYEGTYAGKQGNAKEGVALFWRTDRLRLRRHSGKDQNEKARVTTEILSYGSSAYAKLPKEVHEYVDSRPWMVDTLKRVTSVAQIGTFDLVREEDDDDNDVDRGDATTSANNELKRSFKRRSVTVVNTHLFFANGAPHVRVLQAAMALEAAREHHGLLVRDGNSNSCNDEKEGIVFCGDLNADPKSGCLRFLQRGEMDPGDESWQRGESFRWGDQSATTQEESSTAEPLNLLPSPASAAVAATATGDKSPSPPRPPVLRHTFALQSAHDPSTQLAAGDSKDASSTSQWSNLGCSHATLGFRATLDWIFVGGFGDKGALVVDRSAPLPTMAADGREPDAPLPDSAFPGSDHLAVCADVIWRLRTSSSITSLNAELFI